MLEYKNFSFLVVVMVLETSMKLQLKRHVTLELKGAVSRNSAKLGNYKMPVELRET